MTDAKAETKTCTVLAHFRLTDPKTGKSVSYDPHGDYDEETGLGWPGARKTYTGDPNSDQYKDLLDGAGGTFGPLIAEPNEQQDTPKRSASSSASSSTTASSAKES